MEEHGRVTIGDVIMCTQFSRIFRDTEGRDWAGVQEWDKTHYVPAYDHALFVVEEAHLKVEKASFNHDKDKEGWYVVARQLGSGGVYHPCGCVIHFYQDGNFSFRVSDVEAKGKLIRWFVQESPDLECQDVSDLEALPYEMQESQGLVYEIITDAALLDDPNKLDKLAENISLCIDSFGLDRNRIFVFFRTFLLSHAVLKIKLNIFTKGYVSEIRRLAKLKAH